MTDRRPGRPPLPNGERVEGHQIAFYPFQWTWLLEEALRENTSVSAFIRELVDAAQAARHPDAAAREREEAEDV